MEAKSAAKHPSGPGVRSPDKTEAAFEARSNEIHQSLDNAINKIEKIESGKMNPESATAILEKIKIVQALLFTAERELEDWLQGKKL
jgi:hypothetical protein